MHQLRPTDILFWLLATTAAAMFGLFVLLLAGVVPAEEGSTAAPPARSLPAPTRTESPAATEAARTTETASARTRTTSSTPPVLTTVVVRATRGDCWLLARANSETGRILDERVLPQGESVRLQAAKVWLSLGASANVDVLVDGERRSVPAGTVELVLGSASAS